MAGILARLRLDKIKAWWAIPAVRWLLLIMVAAFALRFAGAGSSVLYTQDNQIVREALDLGQRITSVRKFVTGTDLKYPLTLPILLFVLYGCLFVGGLATGAYHSIDDYRSALFLHQSDIHLTAVAALALIAVAIVPAVYIVAKSLKLKHAAWLAAGLAAGNLALVQFGHQPRPHVALATFSLVAVMLLIAVARGAGWKTCLLATLACAATWGTLQNGMVIAVPLLVAWCIRLYDPADRRWPRKFFTRPVLGNLALFAVLALVLNPALPLVMLNILRTLFKGGQQIDLAPGGSHRVTMSLFTLAALPTNAARLFNYQPLITLVGVPGGLFAAWRLRKDWRLLAVALPFPVINAVAFGVFLNAYPRILIVLTPWLILGTAYVAEIAAERIAARIKRPAALVMGGMAALALIPLAVADVRLDYVLAQTDTRTLATQWVEASVPPGSAMMTTWQMIEVTASQDSIKLQKKAAPKSLGTRDQWLLTLPIKDYPAGPTYDVLESIAYKATIPGGFDGLARDRKVQLGLVDNDLPTLDSSQQGMAAFIAGKGSLAQEICAAHGNGQVFLPEDVESIPVWIDIWQVERPGPFIFIFWMDSGGNHPAARSCQ